MMTSKLICLKLMAAALLAAVVLAPIANAQSGRISLADRVAKLEQTNANVQAANNAAGQKNVELLNRINELQTETQALRGLIEEQKHVIDELQKRNRDQYLDLDGRLNRIEGASAAPNAANNVANGGALTNNTESTSLRTTVQSNAQASRSDVGFVNAPNDSSVANTGSAAPINAAPVPPIDERASVPNAVDPAKEQTDYDQAFAALRDGAYAESARLFAGFVQNYPESALAPNASYWLGESYYVTQNYAIALETFTNLLANFPDSSKAPDALLKLGYCQFELGNVGAAERTLNDVILRYPDTTIARLAEGRLRSLRLESP